MTMRILLPILTGLFLVSVNAEVYKSIDENGNVVFTDKPSPEAEEVKIDKVQTVSPPEVKEFKYSPPEKPVEISYESVLITSPENGTVFNGGDATNVSVNVQIDPALSTESGHKLAYAVNGVKIGETSSTSFSLSNPDRGTNSLTVSVVNKKGKALKTSPAVSFTINKVSVLNPNRPKPPPS